MAGKKKKGTKPHNVLWGKPYIDSNGESRKRWLTVGAAWPDDKGGMGVTIWLLPPRKEGEDLEFLIRPPFSADDKEPGPALE